MLSSDNFQGAYDSNSKGIPDKTTWKERRDDGPHVAFGFDDNVGVLKRGVNIFDNI